MARIKPVHEKLIIEYNNVMEECGRDGSKGESTENMHRLLGDIPGIIYSVSHEKRILSSYLASGVQPRDIFSRED